MKVCVIYGPMFSGKTKALLARIAACDDPNRLVFKHVLDNVRCANRLSSHDPDATDRLDAIAIGSLYQILEHVTDDVQQVFIDEMQFFDPATSISALNMLREKFSKLTITFSGLDLNFKGEPWQTTGHIVGMADEIHQLVGECVVCQSPATHSHLKVKADEVVKYIGGADKYEPRCAPCHTRGMLQETPSC